MQALWHWRGEKVAPQGGLLLTRGGGVSPADNGTKVGLRDEVLHLAFQMEMILSFISPRSASVALKSSS